MVLPRLVDAALAGGPLVVHDDGRQERFFAHVGDVVRAVMALMDNPRHRGPRVQHWQRSGREHLGFGPTSDLGR